MKLFLDTAVYEEIASAVEWGVIDGVTTNPTLIAKAGHDHEEQVKRICQIVGNVSAEVVSERKDDMIVEGRRLASWHKNVIVKVPMTPDGLAAGKVLAGEAIRINVTLCFTVNQALLAAAIGAYIVSPFAGRLDDISEDGMRTVADILKQMFNHPLTEAGQTRFLEDYRRARAESGGRAEDGAQAKPDARAEPQKSQSAAPAKGRPEATPAKR